MKKSELIRLLQDLPGDHEVIVLGDDGQDWPPNAMRVEGARIARAERDCALGYDEWHEYDELDAEDDEEAGRASDLMNVLVIIASVPME